jgi:hypothetical protein
MRDGALDILAVETLVKVDRSRKSFDKGVGGFIKTSTGR